MGSEKKILDNHVLLSAYVYDELDNYGPLEDTILVSNALPGHSRSWYFTKMVTAQRC